MVPALSVVSALILLQTPGGAPSRDSVPLDTIATAGTRTVLPHRLLLRLPIDDPRDALPLAVGVAQRGNGMGIGSGANLSFRPGAAGGASAYIDGAPARFLITGGQGIGLTTDAIESVAVTTGLPDLAAGDGRGGVVSYVTRAGGSRLEGHLLAHTDAPVGDGSSVGYNRFAGSAGGPLSTRLSWFASAELIGQRSAYRGLGAADQPAFLWGAPDTTVDAVTIPTFVQSSGLRRPLDWLTQRRAQAKLVYRYGSGASVAVTGLASELQQRFFPGQDIGDPALFSGARSWSRLAVLNWSQPLGSARPLTLHATVSLGIDRESAGLLTPASEATSRDPALGIAWSALQFTGSDSIPLPLTDRIVRNIRSNAGLRTPLLNRTDLRNVQPYRLNPFGLVSGWPTSGSDGTLSALSERRVDVRLWTEWSVRATHRVRFGADYGRASQTFYQANLLTMVDLDAWIAGPRRLGAFAGDRISLGRLSLDLGARLDRFTPGGDLPRTPGRIFTNPAWNLSAASDDTAYANSVTRVFAPLRSHTRVSPRVHAEFSPADRTVLWADLGQVVQPQTSMELFGRSNTDLSFSAAFDVRGSDAGLLRSTLAELGLHQAIAASLALDASGHIERRGVYVGRIKQFDDPANPGGTLNIDVVTPLDSANLWGLGAALDWRPSSAVQARAVYSYIHSGGTGFQSVAVMAILQPPVAEGDRSTLGSVLRDASMVVLARAASGLSYLPLQNLGIGAATDGFVPLGPVQVPLVHLPWSESIDARFGKALRIGAVRGRIYADVRNLLNLRSVLGVYQETGTPANPLYQARALSPEFASLHSEAQANGHLLANDAVDLRPDCTTWTSSTSGPVNCRVLRGVERRFGNGDGIYDLAEQTTALDTYFTSFFGAWRFTEPGRTIRIGTELEF